MPCGYAEKEIQVLTSVFRCVKRVDRVCAWFVAGGRFVGNVSRCWCCAMPCPKTKANERDRASKGSKILSSS
jgi:hypothetical protein